MKTSDLKVYQHKNNIYEITEPYYCTYSYVAQWQTGSIGTKCAYAITVRCDTVSDVL